MPSFLRRLLAGSLLYSLGGLLNQLFLFFTLPLFTAYLSPQDYGALAILGSYSNFLIAIFGLGLGSSIGIVFNDRPEEQRIGVIWLAFGVLLLSSGVLISLFVLAMPLLQPLIARQSLAPAWVWLMLGASVTGILSMPFLVGLQFLHRSKAYVATTLAATLASIACHVLLIVILGEGLMGKLWAWLITNFVMLGLGATLFGHFRFSHRLQNGLDVSRSLLKQGLPYIPSFLSLYLLQQGNIIVLTRWSGLAQSGIYSLGLTIGATLSLPVSAFSTAWIPMILGYKDQPDQAPEMLGKSLVMYTLGIGTLSMCFYLGAKPVVLLMTQPAFHQAGQIVGPISSAYFLTGLFTILNISPYMAKEHLAIVGVQFITSLSFIGFSILAVRTAGSLGAAWALVAGYLAMVSLMAIWNRLRRSNYLLPRFGPRPLWIFAGFYLAIAVLNLPGLDDPHWHLPWLASLLVFVVWLFWLYKHYFQLLKSQFLTLGKAAS